jgi:exopolysaccharide biosynthesis operon protein EpsL
VHADAADAFNFSISQSVMRDDNIFRLSDNADVQALTGASTRGDTVATAFAGISLDKLVGRQTLRASLDASHARYARFSRLDHDGTNIKGSWSCVLGNHWYGEIAFAHTEALTNFGDFRSSVKNINTSERVSYSANYRFHPDWSLGVSTFRVRSDDSSFLRAANQYETTGTEAVVQFARSNNSGALRLRHTNGNYPNPQVTPLGLVDNSYRQDEIEGSLGWQATGASSFAVRIAKVRRNHEQVPLRDFSGATGRLAWDWLISAKAQFNIAVWRETGAQDDILSSYVVTSGVSLGPTWRPTAKTSVKATIEQQVRSYQGDPATALSGIEQREDRLRIASLSASYVPIERLQLSMTLRHEQRESNFAGFPYRANIAFANAQFSF